MVRTKTRARTLSEVWPNGPPDIKLRPAYRIVYNNRIFKDHTGAPALMSWNSHEVLRSLPPLASWIFYMTHPDVPRDFDGHLLYSDLEYDHQLCRGGEFRYEFFFLPGATVEECHAHFLGEMKARGTIWRQIRKVKRVMKQKKQEQGEEVEEVQQAASNQEPASDEESPYVPESSSDEETASDQDAATDSQLPGLPWPKNDRDCGYSSYRGWFFIYPDADIECRTPEQKARQLCLVQFDPIPPDWEWDEKEEGGNSNPMERPIVSRWMKADNQEEGFESGLFGWMESLKRALWEEAADEATENALKLGWESW
ncbi:uncharacterized protein NECHADRAFT_85151 [Fusarium vanettenii 77-13-4]|uniref:Uncharacterized protein n=1 Tax=Fusarium vanettenii (strain ATCC MYA-4622 / CBS 123669 / FGSC 9596 / NRRL 45880 / 77-13-4) TaxID=660122 RepID=C7YV49_FUSV7|nr:uncharacterized protein NECHADRAFT_85151 [Fusarium vanettenii 77-13-4]EEU44519.1 predicted protein [Fusarium vanettenii 77-13-4]